jgi:hypothetical protein
MANSAGNVVPNLLQIIEGIWKVRMPSTQFRDLSKNARISVEIGIVINANGVDRRT